MIVLGFLFSLIVFSLQGMELESGLVSASPPSIRSLIGDSLRNTMADAKTFASGIIAGDRALINSLMPSTEHLPPRWAYPLAMTGTGATVLIVLLCKGYLPV